MRIRARLLTPVDPDHCHYLPDAVVAWEDGVLTQVGPYDGGPVDRDLRPAVLTPGMVDGHLHFPQTRIIGSASGPLLEWLDKSTFPEEASFADAEHAAKIARYFVRNLASSGTTLSMVYGSVHAASAEALFAELDRSGLRAIAGPVLMDAHSPDALTVPVDEALHTLRGLHERWHGHDARLQVAVVPRFALSCSPAMLRRAGDLARELDLWVTTHLSENLDECAVATSRFDTADYLSIYEGAGMLHRRSVYAHCIHLSDDEWDRFDTAGAVVAHCPDSNFFLGSGHMKTDRVLGRGLNLVMGSDVAAGRSFRIPRILSSAYDNALHRDIMLDPRRLLWWGTRGGALALQHDRVGQIEVGMEADVVAWDLPEWAESEEQVLAWLIFDHDAPRPVATWVRGEVVWERGEGGGYPWR